MILADTIGRYLALLCAMLAPINAASCSKYARFSDLTPSRYVSDNKNIVIGLSGPFSIVC